MKVLFVDPLTESAYCCPSLGLMYMASVLEENNVEASIEEMRFMQDPWIDLARVILQKEPDIIGITANSYTYPDAIKVAKIAKSVYPNVKTIMGGPHVTFTWKATLSKNPDIDIVVLGEGERTLVDLTRALTRDEKFDKVKGIAFMKEGKAITTVPRPFIKKLDKLPYPARHLVSMNKYHEMEESTIMVASRGCNFQCVFCAAANMWGNEIRMRSPKNVVDEMKQINSNYDFDTIGFADDVFTFNKSRTLKICKKIREQLIGIKWECSTRIDLLSKELLTEMKKAGCRAIFLGIESGSQMVLNRLEKNTTIGQAEKVVRWAEEIGIETRLSFMLGCPGESQESVLETLRFARKLRLLRNANINFSMLKVYPGTQLFKQPENFGITFVDRNWGRSYGAPLIPTCETQELSFKKRYLIALSASTIEKATG